MDTTEKSYFLSLIHQIHQIIKLFITNAGMYEWVGAPTNAVTEAMSAYGNSEPVHRSPLTVHTNACFYKYYTGIHLIQTPFEDFGSITVNEIQSSSLNAIALNIRLISAFLVQLSACSSSA